LPHHFNPGEGFVATANHKIIPERYPYTLGYSWAPPYRFRRITQVLKQAQSGDKLDVEALERLQSDVLSLPALQLIDLLRAALAREKPSPCLRILRVLGFITPIKSAKSSQFCHVHRGTCGNCLN